MGANSSKKASKTSAKKVLAAARGNAKNDSANRVQAGSTKLAASKAPGPIDEELLNEAFDYVNEVMIRASQEDAEEAGQAAQKAREDAFRKQEMKSSRRGVSNSVNQAMVGGSEKGRHSENQNDMLEGGKARNGGARSAPLARKRRTRITVSHAQVQAVVTHPW